jgi:hypothetical protein
MPKSPQFQTRLPEDRAEVVERYADKQNISKAEAVRRLIYAGLGEIVEDDNSQDNQDTEDSEDEPDRGAGWWGAAAVRARQSGSQAVQLASITAAATLGVLFAIAFWALLGTVPALLSDAMLVGSTLAIILFVAAGLLYAAASVAYTAQEVDWWALFRGARA